MASITPREALAKRVTLARDAAGITDVDLAERTHIARTTLQRKLAGAAEFTAGELVAIADVVGASAAEWVAAFEADRQAAKVAA